jgi:hypothetical protein
MSGNDQIPPDSVHLTRHQTERALIYKWQAIETESNQAMATTGNFKKTITI